MLQLESLPADTRRVFDFLCQAEQLRAFTLIGGTALALQINHRRSEDLDFWVAADRLDKAAISSLLSIVRHAGFTTALATPQNRIIAAKINGIDLMANAQDHTIDGVKVTFFARNDIPYQYFDAQPRIQDTGTAFSIMSAEGIFAMKSYVIHQRTRSRDIFDLKTFLSRGKSIEEILTTAALADPSASIEYAKAVLVGDIPLDKEDEGFDSIGVPDSMEDLYTAFRQTINAYEQALAEAALRFEQRVEQLPQLERSADAVYTFWRHATEVINIAGSAASVNWPEVERQVIVEAISENGQLPESVAQAICQCSPGSVTEEQQLRVQSLVEELAPQLQAQYLQKSTEFTEASKK